MLKKIFSSALVFSFFSTSVLTAMTDDFCNSSVVRKPFNYKSFEAHKKGLPLVNLRPLEEKDTSADLNILPSWPGYLRFPNPSDSGLLYVDFGADFANWGFDKNSEVTDLSLMLTDGKAPTVGDLSLIARLHGYMIRDYNSTTPDNTPRWVGPSIEFSALQIANNQTTIPLDATSFRGFKRYLAYIANKNFEFKSKIRQPLANFSYQATFFDNLWGVGIQIPLIYRMNEMKMEKLFPLDDYQVLSQKTDFQKIDEKLQDSFFSKYPSGFQDFYKRLLEEKGLSTSDKSTKFGVGDICLNLSRKMFSPYWSLASVGLGIVIPSASQPDRNHVWPAELGNGGFWELKPYLGFYWRYNSLFNPHFSASYQFRFSGAVDRRVARLISYDSSNKKANVVAKDLPLGDGISFQGVTFSGFPETVYPAYAAAPARHVEFKKGNQLGFMVGNIFEEVLMENCYLDTIYQFSYKMKDSVAVNYDNDQYDVNSLMEGTDTWAQLIGLTVGYRWSDKINLEAKASYCFSGRLNPRTFSILAAAQYRF